VRPGNLDTPLKVFEQPSPVEPGLSGFPIGLRNGAFIDLLE
jgi:hypothetical protein